MLFRTFSLIADVGASALRGPAGAVGALLALPAAIEQLNRTLEAMHGEVAEMRRGVDTLVVRVGELREDFAAVREEVRVLNHDEVAPMRRRVDGLHDDVIALGETFDTLRTDLGRLPFMRKR